MEDSDTTIAAPKLFVSYSWTTPDHEQWIIDLATELRALGIDVLLDKWDLFNGDDTIAYMERMVNDPNVKKVILLCDKAYVEKTNNRKSGVGTEAQIISAEIYKQQKQNKFVAVIVERDENGNPYVPTYYKTRIYIDLSSPDTYTDELERLVRWAYDQPLYIKPELGEKPSFLKDEEYGITLSTSFRYKRALDALKNGKSHAIPACIEYFECLANELKKFEIKSVEGHYDDALLENIDQFIPYRNEAINLIYYLALHNDSQESRTALHRFFEQLIPFLNNVDTHPKQRHYKDNYSFIIHELFLYTIACLIKYERFGAVDYLLRYEYYLPEYSIHSNNGMVPFTVLRQFMQSLKDRVKRLSLDLISLRANLLMSRCNGLVIEFQHLMQADLILFLRTHFNNQEDSNNRWFPETLVYAGRNYNAFEIFARSSSQSYFERVKVILGINSKSRFESLIAAFTSGKLTPPQWDYESLNLRVLTGIKEIGTRP